MMISAEYTKMNGALHEIDADFGIGGARYVQIVKEMASELRTTDILDYGCGKATLEKALCYHITNYDPAIPMYAERPRPHQIVVCTDVLEHIEPECLDEVLADLRRLTLLAAFVTIDTRPAIKTLPDGRNAHLIVENARWWLPKLWGAGFNIVGLTDSGYRIKATMR